MLCKSSHVGSKEKSDMAFEVWGEYKDRFVRVAGAWKIAERSMIIYNEIGTREVLGAE